MHAESSLQADYFSVVKVNVTPALWSAAPLVPGAFVSSPVFCVLFLLRAVAMAFWW